MNRFYTEYVSEEPSRPLGNEARGRRTRDDRPELYKLAYDEGKRTVDDQLAELDSMRQRSVQFLAFVGAASAFLVGTSLKVTDRSVIFYVIAIAASLCTLLTVALCISLLLATQRPWRSKRSESDGPMRAWSFRLSPSALVRWIEPDVRPPNESDFYRALAERYEGMAGDNDEGLSKVRRGYICFLGAAVFQLTLWLMLAWLYG